MWALRGKQKAKSTIHLLFFYLPGGPHAGTYWTELSTDVRDSTKLFHNKFSRTNCLRIITYGQFTQRNILER